MSSNQGEGSFVNSWENWIEEETSPFINDTDTFDSLHIKHTSVLRPVPLHPTGLAQFSIDILLGVLMPDPPQCFCKKTAYLSYTLEHGASYDCATYNDLLQVKETICGFHIHKDSWNKLRSDIRSGFKIYVNLPQLNTCPFYNYTFTTVFNLRNRYDMTPPDIFSTCFCNEPVKLIKDTPSRDLPGLYFTCKYSFVKNTTRCVWCLSAKDMVFSKPECMLHTHVDLETYHAYERGNKDELIQFEYQHLSVSLPLSSLEMSETNSSKDELEEFNPSSSFQKTTHELQEEINSLENYLSRIKRDIDFRFKRFEAEVPEYIENAIYQKTEADRVLRLNIQSKLPETKDKLIKLVQQLEILENEFTAYKEDTDKKLGKEDESKKCKLCYIMEIEFILMPCGHFMYCKECAKKLTHCAVCRKEITSLHKVFLC